MSPRIGIFEMFSRVELSIRPASARYWPSRSSTSVLARRTRMARTSNPFKVSHWRSPGSKPRAPLQPDGAALHDVGREVEPDAEFAKLDRNGARVGNARPGRSALYGRIRELSTSQETRSSPGSVSRFGSARLLRMPLVIDMLMIAWAFASDSTTESAPGRPKCSGPASRHRTEVLGIQGLQCRREILQVAAIDLREANLEQDLHCRRRHEIVDDRPHAGRARDLHCAVRRHRIIGRSREGHRVSAGRDGDPLSGQRSRMYRSRAGVSMVTSSE